MPAKSKKRALSKTERSEVRQIAKKATLSLAETKHFFPNSFQSLWPVPARRGSLIAVRGFMLNRNDDFTQVPVQSSHYDQLLKTNEFRTKTTQMLYGDIWAEVEPTPTSNAQNQVSTSNVGFPCLPFDANRRFTHEMGLAANAGLSIEDGYTTGDPHTGAKRIKDILDSNVVEGNDCIPTRTTIQWQFQRKPLVVRPVDIIKREYPRPSDQDNPRIYQYPRGTDPIGATTTDVWGNASQEYNVHNVLNNVESISAATDSTVAAATNFGTAVTEAMASDGFDPVADANVILGAGVALADEFGNITSNVLSAIKPSDTQDSKLAASSQSATDQIADPRAKASMLDFAVMENNFGIRPKPDGGQNNLGSMCGAIAPHLQYEKKLLHDVGFDKYFTTHQFDYQYRFVRVKLKKTKFAGTYPDPRKDLFMDNNGFPTGIMQKYFTPTHCRDYKLNTKLYTVLDDKRFTLGCPGAMNSTATDTFAGLNVKRNSMVSFTTSHKVAKRAEFNNYSYDTYDTLDKNNRRGHAANMYPRNEEPNEFIAVHCWIDEHNDFVYPLTFDETRTYSEVGRAGTWEAEKINQSQPVPIPKGTQVKHGSGADSIGGDANVKIDAQTYIVRGSDGVARDAWAQTGSVLKLPHEYRNEKTALDPNESAGILSPTNGNLNRHPRDAMIQAPNDWTMNCRCVATFKDF